MVTHNTTINNWIIQFTLSRCILYTHTLAQYFSSIVWFNFREKQIYRFRFMESYYAFSVIRMNKILNCRTYRGLGRETVQRRYNSIVALVGRHTSVVLVLAGNALRSGSRRGGSLANGAAHLVISITGLRVDYMKAQLSIGILRTTLNPEQRRAHDTRIN